MSICMVTSALANRLFYPHPTVVSQLWVPGSTWGQPYKGLQEPERGIEEPPRGSKMPARCVQVPRKSDFEPQLAPRSLSRALRIL